MQQQVILAVFALVLPCGAPAAAAIEVTGAIRVRPGLVDGQVRPGAATSEAVLELRTIVNATLTSGPATLFAELRDSRAYGKPSDTALVAGDVNTLEPVQLRASLDLGDLAGEGTRLRLTMGRTEMQFGSRRLLATGDYRNAAFFFTGIDATLESRGGTDLELFWMLPQTRAPDRRAAVLANKPALDRERLAQQIFGLSVLGPVGGRGVELGLTVVGLSERDRPGFATRDRRLWTLGPRFLKQPAAGEVDFDVEAFVQGGHAAPLDQPLGEAVPVRAGMVRALIGYSWRGELSPRLALEFDHVSGDGPGARYGRFDQLFGARRFEFGPSSVYGVLGRANLTSPGIRLSINQSGRADGWIIARGLWAASATDFFSACGVRDADGASGRFAGVQVDSRLRLWLVPRTLRADLNVTGLARRGVLEGAAPGRSSIYVASALEAFF
ncbi:alginate export family protein [Thermaurantiacus sp.]